jgi:ribose/xylose/arabinose/galactoside ABC-type transport system permease subunit
MAIEVSEKRLTVQQRSWFSGFVKRNRRALSALAVFIAILGFFIIASPKVFLNPIAYTSIFTSLPITIILTIPLVFVITAGEIDLSFPSVIGLSAWAFAWCVQVGAGPVVGLILSLVVGMLAGLVNALLITRVGLSSLVSTLGMSFLLRGLIQIGTQGNGIPLTSLSVTLFTSILTGNIFGVIPAQMVWGLLFAGVGWWLFSYHRFGAHICCIGDNPESAREMGINVNRTKMMAFIYVGIAAALAGVISSLINNTFWPTTGDGYLLTTLAAVFVGGTPTWGGVGTVVGAVIGACSVGFIQTGLIGAGMTGFYTQFFYGLVLILSLIGHRFNQQRVR